MASLQTLRNKGGVIVAVVIGIALLSFVLGDMLTSGSTLFGSGSEIGKINGTTITPDQYSQEINTLTEVAKISSGSETITEEQSTMLKQQAWEELITRYAINPELDNLGVSVGIEELTELITGRYVSPTIQQLFADPQTGMFDASYVRQFVSNISMDPTGRLQLFWDNLQNTIANQTQILKYKNLVDKGAYITSQQADFMASVESAAFDIRFVAQKLTSIPDSTVQISQSEVKKYYDANSDVYQTPETRSIEYVVFEALPSTKDYSDAAKYMSDLKTEFEVTDNVEQFVSLNSFTAFDSRYYKEGELPFGLNEFAFTKTPADIYAPEMSNDEIVLARISDVKELPDSLNFAHILLSPDQKAAADSILKAIKSGATTFEEAAFTSSLDQQTASLGGDYGMVDPQVLPTELNREILKMGNNEIKLIELPTSLHITKISNIKGISKKVQLGTIKYSIEPSEATRAVAFNRAANFASGATKVGFSQLAQDSMLSKRVATLASTQQTLQGYDNSREVIRWAYNNKVGSSSEVMEFGDSFLVLSLVGAQEKGLAPIASVQSQIVRQLRDEKKAELLAQKMSGKSMDALAAELAMEPVSGEEITFTTYIAPEFGFDPAFAGGVSGLKKGVAPKPIKGLAAVYLPEIVEVTSNPVSSSMVKERLTAELEQSIFYGAYQTLIDNSDITDTRYKFF